MTTRSQEFTTPGAIAFTVPDDVTMIYVTLTGAGGSGGSKFTFGGVSKPGVAGGGSGESFRRVGLHVTSGAMVAGVVGAGGARAQYTSTKGADGGATSFGPFIALGGYGGQGNATAVGGTAGGGFGAVPLTGANFNNKLGADSQRENEHWNSGASGGGTHTANGTHGLAGGKCDGQSGGVGGNDGTGGGGFSAGGGGGGGASPYGPGGAGGNYNAAGSDAPAGAYGAGGGGPGGDAADYTAGKGGDGYILVEWYEGV